MDVAMPMPMAKRTVMGIGRPWAWSWHGRGMVMGMVMSMAWSWAGHGMVMALASRIFRMHDYCIVFLVL